MKIWIWIKNLFKPKRISPDITSVKPKVDLTGLTKGDIKKLKKQGKNIMPLRKVSNERLEPPVANENHQRIL